MSVLQRRGRPLAGLLAAVALSTAAHTHAHQVSTAPPVASAPGYQALEYEAPVAGSYRLPLLGAATDGRVVDSMGKAGSLHELFSPGVTVLAFIYTQCDDVNGCPLATYVMGQIARRLQQQEDLGERVKLISFSFDVAHDTPSALADYAAAFRPDGANWTFATAPSEAALEPILGSYEQTVLRSGTHSFSHILRVFLIDQDFQIRNIYSTAFLHADTLAADIRTVLIEQGDLNTADPRETTTARPMSGAPHDEHAALLGLPHPEAMNGPEPTDAQIALGGRLFFDRRLSLNNTISCAMCHIPAQGFAANELATSVGIEGRTVKRNAPSLLNVGYLQDLFHDARENRLEQQVWSPLLAANEMGNPSVGFVLDRLRALPDYEAEFQTALGADISMESLGRALAAYQRSLQAAGTPFDRWYFGGQKDALSDSARRGFSVFEGKGNCVGCHSVNRDSALFTDQKLHNTGIGYLASMQPDSGALRTSELAPGVTLSYDLAYVAPSAEKPPNDLGRYEITQNPDDRWKFRTPSLRNVALTAPYMHNGSLASLDDVIDFYDAGGIPNELLDNKIRPLELTAEERDDLREFLLSLTSPEVPRLQARARAIEIGNPQ